MITESKRVSFAEESKRVVEGMRQNWQEIMMGDNWTIYRTPSGKVYVETGTRLTRLVEERVNRFWIA